MLHYRLIQRSNPRDPALVRKWYAVPSSRGHRSIDDISADITAASSLSRGDIRNTICGLADHLPKYLLDGQTVELGELGLLRIGFSSEGVSDIKEFHPSDIDHLKILFLPGKILKKILGQCTFQCKE